MAMPLIHVYHSRRSSAFLGYGSGYSAVKRLGSYLVCRVALRVVVWTLGACGAALWLVLLDRSHFGAVKVALGPLCEILILRPCSSSSGRGMEYATASGDAQGTAAGQLIDVIRGDLPWSCGPEPTGDD
jgi:hypothetical protein